MSKMFLRTEGRLNRLIAIQMQFSINFLTRFYLHISRQSSYVTDHKADGTGPVPVKTVYTEVLEIYRNNPQELIFIYTSVNNFTNSN